ncbi:MAG: universal stress protein [Alphaproteobacteria bacterium]|nr:universal stress protein [Alphaproteobacteria bacterium]
MSDTILVAVDIAGCAPEVVAETAWIAAGLKARVVLLHLAHLPVGVHAGDAVRTGTHPEGASALSTLDDDAREHMALLQAILADKGVPSEVLIRHGDPLHGILTAADEVDARIIVCGTHGRQGLQRMLMGSVAEEVLRRARVPVLVVRTLTPGALEDVTPTQRQVAVEAEG